ncbi:MAG TPA: hypothetical protein P5081_09685, partial [Phycisphaerae bacterium]|nr:hypothetical protein [Phycisphaerae bacterium]
MQEVGNIAGILAGESAQTHRRLRRRSAAARLLMLALQGKAVRQLCRPFRAKPEEKTLTTG